MTRQEKATIAITTIFTLYAGYFMMIFSNKCSLIPTLVKTIAFAGLVALAASLIIMILKRI